MRLRGPEGRLGPGLLPTPPPVALIQRKGVPAGLRWDTESASASAPERWMQLSRSRPCKAKVSRSGSETWAADLGSKQAPFANTQCSEPFPGQAGEALLRFPPAPIALFDAGPNAPKGLQELHCTGRQSPGNKTRSPPETPFFGTKHWSFSTVIYVLTQVCISCTCLHGVSCTRTPRGCSSQPPSCSQPACPLYSVPRGLHSAHETEYEVPVLLILVFRSAYSGKEVKEKDKPPMRRAEGSLATVQLVKL